VKDERARKHEAEVTARRQTMDAARHTANLARAAAVVQKLRNKK
jgi:hypothetical protein